MSVMRTEDTHWMMRPLFRGQCSSIDHTTTTSTSNLLLLLLLAFSRLSDLIGQGLLRCRHCSVAAVAVAHHHRCSWWLCRCPLFFSISSYFDSLVIILNLFNFFCLSAGWLIYLLVLRVRLRGLLSFLGHLDSSCPILSFSNLYKRLLYLYLFTCLPHSISLLKLTTHTFSVLILRVQ